MEKTTIEVGDKVNIFFEYLEPIFNATVNGIPCATGDCWKLTHEVGIIGNMKTKIVYVQNFSKIESVGESV